MDSWLKIKEKIKKSPKTPGIYVFYDKRKPLYIGKASILKKRLQSYLKTGYFKNDLLHENATDLKFIPLRSEIEALIEESRLIKELNPSYNVLWRDDKSYFYAVITNDKFPKIFVVHKNQAVHSSRFNVQGSSFVGPFTEGRALRLVLKMLRRYFPYCTCPKPHFRICLNAQIDNCLGFCCKKDKRATPEQIKQYQKNVRIIKKFLLGKNRGGFSENLKPEQKSALEKVLAHREFLESFNIQKNLPLAEKTKTYLIEGYDISHLAGRETVAGMTAWSFYAGGGNGELSARKDFWRKFIIRTAKPGDDPAAMSETISRRLNHPKWRYPDLMVIDGGKGQLSAAKSAMEKSKLKPGKKIKIISFAKPERLIYGLGKTGVKIENAAEKLQKIIPTVVSETHYFAVRFHRYRRKKIFLDSVNL
ncbi:MAG: GIY-YIG nuclease family protein [Patescibacteria group bacterium]